MSRFSENDLTSLRNEVKTRQSEKRFLHTCGVEEEAAYLGSIYMPDCVDELRAAAILHDLTKGIPDSEQIPFCEENGIPLTEEDKRSPQILHGKSAEMVIKRDFPAFATPRILQAVRYHTTGDVRMTLFDKIIFLSDYIEAGRPYDNCKCMREKFHAVCENGRTEDLDNAICNVIQLTVYVLKKENLPIAPATLDAYHALTGEKL